MLSHSEIQLQSSLEVLLFNVCESTRSKIQLQFALKVDWKYIIYAVWKHPMKCCLWGMARSLWYVPYEGPDAGGEISGNRQFSLDPTHNCLVIVNKSSLGFARPLRLFWWPVCLTFCLYLQWESSIIGGRGLQKKHSLSAVWVGPLSPFLNPVKTYCTILWKQQVFYARSMVLLTPAFPISLTS